MHSRFAVAYGAIDVLAGVFIHYLNEDVKKEGIFLLYVIDS